ncbi:MAG: aldolase/citrate lyase family protein [Dehalococcoidia bacterium]|nr:aldolase/citrate lyase family protein [Dehalococcoidia bacterium]
MARERNYSTNQLKKTIDSGGIGVIANGPNNSDICDFLGHLGFDAAFIDFEHGNVSWAELPDIARACELWGMASLVRVNRLDEAQRRRTLDQGASAVMVPHVITAADAELAASACKYPPDGIRGVAGGRPAYGVEDYFRKANEEVQCLALIEDYEAIDNLAELTAVEGIDVFYVAPSDMAASMGHTGDPGHREVQEAIERAIKLIIGAGRVAGTLANDQNLDKFLAMGVRCIGVPWQLWLKESAEAFLARTRRAG